MSGSAESTYDPTRHPDLLAWLAERQAGFTPWAEATGVAGRFDFTPESLEVLDALVRETADDMDQITDQRLSPFVQGAVWYVGEVFCRHKQMVWKYTPDVDSGELPPFLDPSGSGGALDHPCVAPKDAGWEGDLYPLNMLRRILIDEDELGTPIEETLTSIFENPYAEDEMYPDDDHVDPSGGW
ncbi:hypothetical protein ACGFMM_24210 [Streptomyces sp. NPDC048604]|uniref:hypothetical protein n=1 Tax=Streptomyces sp. NPDC048604 TaxID=3365578 RepID=UPI00371927B5